MCLFSMMMQETHCTAEDMQAASRMTWTDSLLDIFVPAVDSFRPLQHCFYDLGQFLHAHAAAVEQWMSACDAHFFYKKLIVRVCPRYSPSIVHDSAPLTDAIVPQKRNLCHPP
jgi:hypothetical protein